MKPQIKQIRLLMIFATVTLGIALHSTAAGQSNSVVAGPATPSVSRGEKVIPKQTVDDCNQMLLKTLDALDKAEKALGAALNEIEARKRLDSLKDELLKAKDQYIADVLADNAFLRKANQPTLKSKVRKFFETVEKIALLAAGIYIGRL